MVLNKLLTQGHLDRPVGGESGFELEMCMGMGFPMGTGIPWESHGNGNKTQNWEWEWEGMGNYLSGNGNYMHSTPMGIYSQRFYAAMSLLSY